VFANLAQGQLCIVRACDDARRAQVPRARNGLSAAAMPASVMAIKPADAVTRTVHDGSCFDTPVLPRRVAESDQVVVRCSRRVLQPEANRNGAFCPSRRTVAHVPVDAVGRVGPVHSCSAASCRRRRPADRSTPARPPAASRPGADEPAFDAIQLRFHNHRARCLRRPHAWMNRYFPDGDRPSHLLAVAAGNTPGKAPACRSGCPDCRNLKDPHAVFRRRPAPATPAIYAHGCRPTRASRGVSARRRRPSPVRSASETSSRARARVGKERCRFAHFVESVSRADLSRTQSPSPSSSARPRIPRRRSFTSARTRTGAGLPSYFQTCVKVPGASPRSLRERCRLQTGRRNSTPAVRQA